MKFCFSNIAWDNHNEDLALEILSYYNIDAIEIAPTKFWNDLENISDKDLKDKRLFFEKKNISLPAMQSLLFGKPELKIFDINSRVKTAEYLMNIISIASKLGIKNLVFGSPKNRLRENLSLIAADKSFNDFFQPLADYSNLLNVCICLEANSKVYNCDYINTSDEAFKMVKLINNQGFGLHLDYGNMLLEDENITKQLTELLPHAKHFHLSAPQMNEIQSLNTIPKEHINLLKKFNGYISVEMLIKNQDKTNFRMSLESAIVFLKNQFI